MDLHRLEQAAFAAWPALQEHTLAGWRLRFSNGYTKRANSANAVTEVQGISDAQIAAVEDFYRSRLQPPIFRLASFCTSRAVDDALADRGYRWADASWVMVRTLESPKRTNDAIAMSSHDASTWLTRFDHIAGHSGSDPALHLELLQRIQGVTAFASVDDGSGPVSCALGVVSDGLLGLFDLATRPDARAQGHATALCQSMLAWGRQQGASHAYLQVVAANVKAIHLYESVGFRRAYQYGYRVGAQAK